MKAYELAATIFVVISVSTAAHSVPAGPAVDVTVDVTGDGMVPGLLEDRAMATVTRMYARIGVRIAWLHRTPQHSATFASPVVIHVQFDAKLTGNHSPGALASTAPFGEGVKTVSVVFDRIERVAGGSSREERILAHVLAHEIGHVLQVTNYHAPSGVMKACWNNLDFDVMQSKPLEFTSTDVDLIQQGLKLLKASVGPPAGSISEL